MVREKLDARDDFVFSFESAERDADDAAFWDAIGEEESTEKEDGGPKEVVAKCVWLVTEKKAFTRRLRVSRGKTVATDDDVALLLLDAVSVAGGNLAATEKILEASDTATEGGDATNDARTFLVAKTKDEFNEKYGVTVEEAVLNNAFKWW